MNESNKYHGIILAAGLGARIKPLSFSYPKSMLPICNKPIIQYQIESMINLGIKKILIVCGQFKKSIQKQFKDGSNLGIRIQYVEQEKPLGIAHALLRAEPYVDRPFLLFLGDIFFITTGLNEMLDLFEKRQACGILAVKQELRDEYIRRNYAVLLHESGMVKRVVEKPRYLSNNLKGCGIYFFDLSIFDAVRRTPRTAMRDEYEITSSIQILIDDGYPVYPAEVIEWDMNITIVDDLILSNLKKLDILKKDNEIGRNVSCPPKSQIIHSVIGHNVIIESPIVIQNSVVMDNTRITTKDDLKDVLVTEDLVIPLGKS